MGWVGLEYGLKSEKGNLCGGGRGEYATLSSVHYGHEVLGKGESGPKQNPLKTERRVFKVPCTVAKKKGHGEISRKRPENDFLREDSKKERALNFLPVVNDKRRRIGQICGFSKRGRRGSPGRGGKATGILDRGKKRTTGTCPL